METARRLLHIGIWSARWPPAHLGGAELQAARIARELAARGHHVHVFTRAAGAGTQLECAPGVRLHPRRTLRWAGLRLAGEVCAAFLQAERLSTDVNLCYITLNSGLLGYVVRCRRGTPFVVALRGLDEALPGRRTLRTSLERFVHVRADRLWMQSQHIVDIVRDAYDRSGNVEAWHRIEPAVRVVPNGVEMPAPVDALPLPPRRFLFVGRLVPEKDLHTLIAAARLVPDVDIDIVGDGPLAEDLQLQARGTRVRLLGRRAPEEIPALLHRSRGLILCSKTEGLPNVVLESLSHGRPVIATAVGAIPELVQDGVNGCLVARESPEALAVALRRLCDDPAWCAMAAATRPSVERFAWPRVMQAVEDELVATAALGKPRTTRKSP